MLDPNARALLARPFYEHNIVRKNPEKTIWCLRKKVWENFPTSIKKEIISSQIKCIFLQQEEKQDIIAEVLEKLTDENIYSVLVEGGPFTWSSFLDGGFANKVYCFQSPDLLGGKDTVLSTQILRQKIELTPHKITPFDHNILIESYTK